MWIVLRRLAALVPMGRLVFGNYQALSRNRITVSFASSAIFPISWRSPLGLTQTAMVTPSRTRANGSIHSDTSLEREASQHIAEKPN